MKKTYITPVVELEVFETADIITVSTQVIQITYNTDYTTEGEGLPTIGRDEFGSENN